VLLQAAFNKSTAESAPRDVETRAHVVRDEKVFAGRERLHIGRDALGSVSQQRRPQGRVCEHLIILEYMNIERAVDEGRSDRAWKPLH
jgi:hypothetical protein